jgi:hypothetical protein
VRSGSSGLTFQLILGFVSARNDVPDRTRDRLATRRPRGYAGIDHQTIGSDLLAVRDALHMPEHVLGGDTMKRLALIEPDAFYPVEWFLELMEELDRGVGRVGLVRLGRRVFKLSHEKRVLEVARSARDIVYGIDGMYKHAHRGQGIGGWEVQLFAPGRAELDKTTPHHCAMEEGILLEALFAVGAPSRIEQRQCFREGASSCIFVITSVITDAKWLGTR